MDLRAKYKETFEKKHGVGLGFMSFFVKAAVEALKAFPLVNARIDGADIVYQHFYDIGVAVSTEKGLMVPVAPRRRPARLRRDREGDRRAGREGPRRQDRRRRPAGRHVHDHQRRRLRLAAVARRSSTRRRAAILGMHAIQKRPVAVDDQVVIRPMMYLALTYDHRLIDGREAVQFLVRVKECVENPERLLLEI